MLRNLKVLGLALAVMATMGIAAASASAAQFHSETTPTELTGTQTVTNTFTIDEGTQVHCTSAKFEGTVSGATTQPTVTVTPVYTGCTATPFGGATVHHNGCKYIINASGTVALSGCTNANKSIVITAPFCTVEVTEAQNKELESVSFKNVGTTTTREVEVVANITNIKYHASGFACPYGSNTTGGKYQGTVKVTGENPVTKAHHGIWWSA